MTMNLYQIVTDRILEQLEKGTAPWVKPWQAEANQIPHNAISGKPYRGINAWLLFAPAGSSGNGWLTYKQAQNVGANVRKGEKGQMIVFYKPWKVTDKNAKPKADGTEATRFVPLLRYFKVFHTSQIENLPEKYLPKEMPAQPADLPQCFQAAQKILEQATILHDDGRAFYRHATDTIHMPTLPTFNTPAEYYATALHELTHWSGAKHRMNREFGKRFGDSAYAFEELVAEMGAAFLCAATKVEGRLQHAEYLASWIKILKSDNRAIMKAANDAQKAADFIQGIPAYNAERVAEESAAA